MNFINLCDAVFTVTINYSVPRLQTGHDGNENYFKDGVYSS